VNLGVAAHITAASPNGPRFAPTLTIQQRRPPDNGIWLCQNCAHLIDTDKKHYTSELLRAWKIVTEDRARGFLGKTAVTGASPTMELYLEEEGIQGGYYSMVNPQRVFVLGLRNVKGGTAKFPGIRYMRRCGLMVDQYGIDGSFGFGLPRSPSDSEWESFRGGADNVIHPEQLIKIAKLRQNGGNRFRETGDNALLKAILTEPIPLAVLDPHVLVKSFDDDYWRMRVIESTLKADASRGAEFASSHPLPFIWACGRLGNRGMISKIVDCLSSAPDKVSLIDITAWALGKLGAKGELAQLEALLDQLSGKATANG
jgi:hypothetical protein